MVELPEGFTQKEWLDIFPVLESVTRFNILIFLNNEGEKLDVEIREELDIEDLWLFTHHINPLLQEGLVEYDGEWHTKFCITEKGKRVLEILLPEEELT